jgi:uncharacterized membrane protein
MDPSHLQYFPLPPFAYAVFAGLLFVLFLLIQFGLLRYVYERIGLDSRSAILILAGSLLGSYMNIPVAQIPEARVQSHQVIEFYGVRYLLPVVVDWPGTVVAVNVGGALIPAALSIYLLARNQMWAIGAVATAVVAIIVHLLAQIVPGAGIAVPIFAPPLATAATAVLLSRDLAAPLAYVSGSLGTLIGADLLNLGRLHEIETPIVSIGGAGTFDGIFLTGILAVLLAGLGRSRSAVAQ